MSYEVTWSEGAASISANCRAASVCLFAERSAAVPQRSMCRSEEESEAQRGEGADGGSSSCDCSKGCSSRRASGLRSGTGVVERGTGRTGSPRNEAIRTLVTAIRWWAWSSGIRTWNACRRVGFWTYRIQVITFQFLRLAQHFCSMTLRLGCWRQEAKRFRNGMNYRSGSSGAPEPSSQRKWLTNAMQVSRDERERRKARSRGERGRRLTKRALVTVELGGLVFDS
jgi:hypothetical protein